MRAWVFFLHWVHDHILFILVGGVVVLFIAAWLVVEALRGSTNKDELYRLRQRLYQLEREKSFSNMDGGPVVLPSRWIGVGGAATTSDGGCLLLVEAASPLQKRVMVTVRVDGMPVRKSSTIMVGQRLRLDGKSGIYSIELFGAEKDRARFAVSLRSHHFEASESEAGVSPPPY